MKQLPEFSAFSSCSNSLNDAVFHYSEIQEKKPH